jgi:hypothetical protein
LPSAHPSLRFGSPVVLQPSLRSIGQWSVR